MITKRVLLLVLFSTTVTFAENEWDEVLTLVRQEFQDFTPKEKEQVRRHVGRLLLECDQKKIKPPSPICWYELRSILFPPKAKW